MKTTELIIALPVTSREQAFAFYKALGLQLARDPESDVLPEPLEMRLADDVVLMLVPRDGFAFVAPGNNVAHAGTSETVLTLSMASNDQVHDMLQRAETAGGTILREAAPMPWGYAAQFKDLDGHIWMVTVPPTA